MLVNELFDDDDDYKYKYPNYGYGNMPYYPPYPYRPAYGNGYYPSNGYRPPGGYGGGFYDRTLSTLQPRPYPAGLAYSHGYVPWLRAEPHDVPLDAVLSDEGLAWQAPAP